MSASNRICEHSRCDKMSLLQVSSPLKSKAPNRMTDSETPSLPCVVLFNINGSGMGHLSTCLGYANRLRGRARPVFFSLASAIETIHEMGFEADYFVSRFWSRASGWAWDRQLALRLVSSRRQHAGGGPAVCYWSTEMKLSGKLLCERAISIEAEQSDRNEAAAVPHRPVAQS